MFFSLNKKFIYTLSLFFIFMAVIFVYTFYIVYGSKIQEEQKSTILRNQQYIELLYENINLRKDINKLINNEKITENFSPNNSMFNFKIIEDIIVFKIIKIFTNILDN